MRDLIAKDIAPFMKLIAKMELKPVIKSMFNNSEEEKGQLVTELIWGIIENYSKAEKEFYIFLGDLEGKKPEEIAELPLTEFINLITELFSQKNMPFLKLAAK